MSTFLILSNILAIICIVIIIYNTETPVKALAYSALVIALPIVGIIIYFSIGFNLRKNILYKKKLEYNQALFPDLQKRLEEINQNLRKNSLASLGHFSKLAEYDDGLNFLSPNNLTDLLINGENKFPKVIEDLKNAKKYIHFEYYIYENDNIGTQIGDLLIEKAKEGLQVRFIYDDFGSNTLSRSFIRKLKHNGVEVFPFYKIRWWLFANRLNYRNHRKIIIIDGEIGYMGGINVSDKYINNGQNKLYWRDTHIKLEGPSVWMLQFIFLTDWNYCAQQNLEINTLFFPAILSIDNQIEDKWVQIISSGPDSQQKSILYTMIQAIMLSKNELLITTPYFIPEPSFIDALKIARLSGTNIKIMIPGQSDSKFVNAVANTYYEELLAIGIEIYRYDKGFIHAKTMICDGQVSFIGTANLDQRSFDLNFEVNSIVFNKDFAEEVKNSFQEDLKVCTPILYEEWIQRPKFTQFLERLARLTSPLM